MPRIMWRLDAPLTPRATSQAVHAVRKLLKRGAHGNLVKLLRRARAVDAALLVEALAPRERYKLFAILLQEQASAVAGGILAEIDRALVPALAANLGPGRLASVAVTLPADEATRLTESLPEELRAETLALMQAEKAAAVRDLLTHEERTAGRIMSPDVYARPETDCVAQAIAALQSTEDESPSSGVYLYAVDAAGHLTGVVNLRRLVVSRPDTPLRDLMERDVLRVSTTTPQSQVAQMIEQYGLLALPVVDDEGRLVGQVSIDDIVDLLQDETTEDLLALSGVAAEERPATPPRRALRLRAPWLMVNLGTAFIASLVVRRFEGTIAQIPTLAVLMPIVAGMGGNSATQTLTVVVRALALDESASLPGVLRKELLVSLGNGLLNGSLCAVVVALVYRVPWIGVLLGLAMLINMVIAGLAGSLTPILLQRFGIDPAVASSVFVTTCTDVGGFFSFLGLATLLITWLR